MKKSSFKLFCSIFLFASTSNYAQNAKTPADYVNPMIGTEAGGNVFPGATLPFGLVKLGPDCGLSLNAGWDKNSNIQGFSHTHVSGTGGGAKYGNVLIIPVVGNMRVEDHSSPRSDEHASAGLYSVKLGRYNVSARLTATHSAGMHEYTFPANDQSQIVIDAGSFLKSRNSKETQQFVGSEVRILSNTEVEGYNRIRNGWNMGDAYTVYFYAQFNTPAKSFGTWKGDQLHPNNETEFDQGKPTGVYFQYKTSEDQKIIVKVGISFVSLGKAKENAKEIDSWDFDAILSKAKEDWNKQLGIVSLKTSEVNKTIFYTALYHAFLQPSDRTGENPKWNSDEPLFDDYYAIWDTFRATHPLFTLLYPSKQEEMLRSLIDIYKHDGYMPDARSGNDNGRTQGGSDCDMLFADAITKGLKNIDYEEALKAMLKNAEVSPGGDERKEGRGGLADYNKLGYVSTDYERAGSRTMEYSNNDYAIAVVAKALGKEDIFKKYIKKADSWQNLWNKDMESYGFKGFICPKDSKGNWNLTNFTPLKGGTWPDFFYETFSWELSLYVPQNMQALIEMCGGKDKFIARLNTYFTHDYEGNSKYTGAIGLFQVANEPGFLAPCLYNYVNRPDKTAEIVRKIISEKYNATPGGIPGNDDSGSMSSWYAFHSMGFYPNAGQNVYLISSPIFEEVTIKMENGATFKVTAKNASDKNIYVQSAKLNGQTLNQCWFKHTDIKNGGSLEFVMGNKPSNWAKNGILPPSLGE